MHDGGAGPPRAVEPSLVALTALTQGTFRNAILLQVFITS